MASPVILTNRSKPLVPADLAAMPSLSWSAPHQEHQWSLDGPEGATAVIRHHPRYVTEDMVALRAAALRGIGIVQMPLMMVRQDILDGALIDVLPGWAPKPGIIHAVFPSRRGLLPSVRALLDFLGEGYAGLSRQEG